MATLYLVTYRTAGDREQARARYFRLAAATNALAPQRTAPAHKRTSSGNSSGWYVEYAYQDQHHAPSDPVVAGLWWDDDNSLSAGFLVAYWSQDLGGSWDPLRDLWNRTS